MAENGEKCPSHFPRTQGDILEFLVLSNSVKPKNTKCLNDKQEKSKSSP